MSTYLVLLIGAGLYLVAAVVAMVKLNLDARHMLRQRDMTFADLRVGTLLTIERNFFTAAIRWPWMADAYLRWREHV